MEENKIIEEEEKATEDNQSPDSTEASSELQEEFNAPEMGEVKDEAPHDDPAFEDSQNVESTNEQSILPQPTELQQNPPQMTPNNLDLILDIPMEITVELGRGRILIHKLLQLGQGSVIELTKLAGDPLDIFVNGRLIAKGEVVVVNDKFGIRLSDIISPMERIERLK